MFNGHDSLCLEESYQRLQKNRGSGGECEVSVLGDMYEANVVDKMVKPIYWTGVCVCVCVCAYCISASACVLVCVHVYCARA